MSVSLPVELPLMYVPWRAGDPREAPISPPQRQIQGQPCLCCEEPLDNGEPLQTLALGADSAEVGNLVSGRQVNAVALICHARCIGTSWEEIKRSEPSEGQEPSVVPIECPGCRAQTFTHVGIIQRHIVPGTNRRCDSAGTQLIPLRREERKPIGPLELKLVPGVKEDAPVVLGPRHRVVVDTDPIELKFSVIHPSECPVSCSAKWIIGSSLDHSKHQGLPLNLKGGVTYQVEIVHIESGRPSLMFTPVAGV